MSEKSEPKITVEFDADVEVKDAEGKVKEFYRAGEVVEMSAASARVHQNLRRCHEVQGKTPKRKRAATPAAKSAAGNGRRRRRKTA